MAGTETLYTAAAVIFGGLITTTLVSLFALPVACLRLGSASAASPQDSQVGEPPGADQAGEPGRVPPPIGLRG